MTPEGKVKADVKKFLNSRGVWYWMPVSNGMGQVGIPDFVCCYKGLFIGIETKAPGKLSTVTPNQQRVLGEIKAHGGLSLVVDSVDSLSPVFDCL